MTDFNIWLKSTMLNQLATILKETMDQMYLDTFIQQSNSYTINNHFYNIDQDYAKFYINKIIDKLQLTTTQLYKNKLLQLDSRKCPEHIKPVINNKLSIPNQINLNPIDIAKQREYSLIYKDFISPHKLIFLDIETDSLNINTANILQISLLEIQCSNNSLNPFIIKPLCNSYIKPYNNYIIDKNNKSTKIHNITQKQIDKAPHFHELAMDIVDQTVLATLVGFNIQYFDIPILLKNLKNSKQNPGWTHTIDLAQAYWKYFPSTLENALKALKIQHEPLHNAQNDAIACIDLLAALIIHNKLPTNPEGFQKLLKNSHENATRYGKSIIQRNENPTHPWIEKDWKKHYDSIQDIKIKDDFLLSKPQPLSSTNKRQYNFTTLENRGYNKKAKII